MSLRNERLNQILTEARPKIARHWSLYDGGFGHGGTAAAVARVDELLVGYFGKLKDFPDAAPATTILHEIEMLLRGLAEVNASCGGAYLETDERDLLVPIIIEAATVAGLDANAFEDADPTLQFRAKLLIL
jgi:hypothetical protein